MAYWSISRQKSNWLRFVHFSLEGAAYDLNALLHLVLISVGLSESEMPSFSELSNRT